MIKSAFNITVGLSFSIFKIVVLAYKIMACIIAHIYAHIHLHTTLFISLNPPPPILFPLPGSFLLPWHII